MAATAPLSTPRVDETARAALATVERAEQGTRLWVTIGECVGEQLIEAFRRVGEAYYSGKYE